MTQAAAPQEQKAAEKAPAPSRFSRPGLRGHVRMMWGKIRRWYLIKYRPAYVERQLELRRGACAHSGACCHLSFRCAFLRPDRNTGEPGCTIYPWRPSNCSIFPIDERDLRDRDVLMPETPCGYYFVTEAEAEREAGDDQIRKPTAV